MMLRAKSAKRYSKVFYDLAMESNEITKLIEDFRLISVTVASSKELKAILSVPMVSKNKRCAIISSIFSGYISEKTLQYINFLIDKNRIAIVEDVYADLVDLYNNNNGLKYIKVFSACELSSQQLITIEEKIGLKINKKITAEIQVLPELIGGFKIQVDDEVYDFSVLSQLDGIKNSFINAG